MQWVFLPPKALFYKSQRWRCETMHFKYGVQISQWSNGSRVRDHSFTGTGFVSLHEKRKLRCKGNFYHLRHVFTIYNGENVWKWVLNLVLKFHDDPTVNESEIVILLRQIWVYAGKMRGFWEEEKRKRDLEEEKT